VPSPEMIIGLIVHKAIELYWDNEVLSQEYLYGEMTKRLPNEDISYASHCLHTYHSVFQYLILEGSTAEERFKIPLVPNVFVVGTMDRISNGTIFDWKTDRYPLKNVSRTPQFILYNWAYKKLYGHQPAGVYYAALSSGSLVKFNYDPVVEKILIEGIIPQIVRDMKNKNYIPNGIFTKSCYKCQYSTICQKDIGGNRVVDNPNNAEK
jgi:hypothetical protein